MYTDMFEALMSLKSIESTSSKSFSDVSVSFGKIKGITCWPDLNHEPFQLKLQ